MVARGLLLGVVAGVLMACSSAPSKQELGKLPNVVTTAEPEWLPFAIRAGARATEDPRELRLEALREIPSAGEVSRVSWAADGRSLVLDNELGVVVLDLSTGKIVRVSAPEEEAHHGVSAGPHGEFVVYATSARGGQIVSVRRDGTERAVVRAGSHPVLVGDGTRPLDALFCLSRGSSAEVLSMQPVRADATTISFDGAASLDPLPAVADYAISADRARTAWLTPEGAMNVASLGAAGGVSAPKALADHGVSAPAFHPDGRHVVVATTLDDPQPQLALVDAEGASARAEVARERLTFAEGGSTAPAFSRDGRYLAFVSGRGSRTSEKPSRLLHIARFRNEP
ncbi:MAG: hypothetical protein U0414_38785 [Polyangiaceae bacterium]